MKLKKLTLTLLFVPLLLASCNSNNFKNWKENGAIETIKNYIDDVCNKNSENFIPEEGRISTWDIDGTGILERNQNNKEVMPQLKIYEYTYKTYRPEEQDIKTAYDTYVDARDVYWSNENSYEAYSAYLTKQDAFVNATVNGLTPSQVQEYFDAAVENGDYTEERKLNNIGYAPMKEIYKYLKLNNFEIYFVSGSVRQALYALASNIFGDIDPVHCIGTDLKIECVEESGEYVTKFIGMDEFCIKQTKVNKIVNEIGKTPVITFGNSTGDIDMLKYTISNEKYTSLSVVINHDDETRENRYNVETIHDMCVSIGAVEVSMKNDFVNLFNN